MYVKFSMLVLDYLLGVPLEDAGKHYIFGGEGEGRIIVEFCKIVVTDPRDVTSYAVASSYKQDQHKLPGGEIS